MNPGDEQQDGVKKVTVAEAFPQCRQDVARLAECIKNHPSNSPTSVICQRFAKTLGWCITLSLCASQARQLEDCCGGNPGLVPCGRERCAREHVRLDLCMQQFTGSE